VKLSESGVITLVCRLGIHPGTTYSWSSIVFALAACVASIFWTEVEGNEPDQKTTPPLVAAVGANAITQFEALTAKAQATGQVPVILRLNVNFQAENRRSASAVITQRNAIAEARNAVVQSLAGANASNIKGYQYVPYLAVTVNATALQALAKNPRVTGISEDVLVPPTLTESTGVVGADIARQSGYDGSGWAVAVLDSGVDKNHNFLSGKVISEACYSTTNRRDRSTSLCPGGVASSTATDSGLNCPLSTYGCNHGTHVAGIVAGKDYTPNGPGYNGVANGANIIAIQVFSQFSGANCTNYGLPDPCALSYLSDQMLGLERAYALRTTFNIAAANMSLGGGQYTSNCDTNSLKASIDNLRVADIATVIASGNSSFTNAMGAPACISSAVSVGATCDSATAGRGCTAIDDIPDYSNIAAFISLLAPGSLISSPTPGTNSFQSWHGTSMAAPHVAGAWALMKQQDPGATVSTILAALQNTGAIVDDLRAAGSVTGMRRIKVDNALLPQIAVPTFIFPSGGESLHAATTINVTWDTNGAPESSYYDLSYRDNCTAESSWIPIGTSSSGASSLSWTIPVNSGGDYCLGLQGMAPGYMNSLQVITNAFAVADADSDGDGVGNIYEVTVLETNPESVDSDGDGLADGAGGVVPLAALPDGIDVNEDGFVDGEMDWGTDPAVADSDNDGITDGDEVSLYGIDPTISNAGDVGPAGSPDNLLTLGDLVVLTRLVTGAIQPTAFESILGDINSDGQLNAADILLLQQAILISAAPLEACNEGNSCQPDGPASSEMQQYPAAAAETWVQSVVGNDLIDVAIDDSRWGDREAGEVYARENDDFIVLYWPNGGEATFDATKLGSLVQRTDYRLSQPDGEHRSVALDLSAGMTVSFSDSGNGGVSIFERVAAPPPPTGNGIVADGMYWKYNGKQILLLGGMAHGEPHLTPKTELIRELDKLKESGGNYMRMTMVSVFPKTRVQGMHPFVRRSDGKFDLNQLNPTFWDHVKVLLEEAQKREMIVQVELWDQWEFYKGSYDKTYWNPKNNSNYTSSATGLETSLPDQPYKKSPAFFYSYRDSNKTVVLKYQRAFIQKLLEVAKPFNNVIYEIGNESSEPQGWNDYWAKYIKSNAGKKVYVTDQREDYIPDGNLTYVLNHPDLYNFIDVSQVGMEHITSDYHQKHYNDFIDVRNKILASGIKRPMNNTKGYKWVRSWGDAYKGGEDVYINRLWHGIFAGLAGFGFHPSHYEADSRSGSAMMPNVLRNIKSMRMLEERVDITRMSPGNHLLNGQSADEAYALASASQYAVYFTGKADRTVILKRPSSESIKLMWLNPDTGELDSPVTVTGTEITLQAPGLGRHVAILSGDAAPPPPPTGSLSNLPNP
jgi:subtilisin